MSYDDGTDNWYELFNGKPIAVPPESGRNNQIAVFLLLQFARFIHFRRLRGQGLEIEVQGEPKNRFPDLTILREDHYCSVTTTRYYSAQYGSSAVSS